MYTMKDLTVDRVMAVHAAIMEKCGGDSRILSEANLHQVVFSANLISGCVSRAAFVFYSLCAYPAFREGNTDTAITVTEMVLSSGGLRITGGTAGIMALGEGIAAFVTEPEEVEHWLCHNTGRSG